MNAEETLETRARSYSKGEGKMAGSSKGKKGNEVERQILDIDWQNLQKPATDEGWQEIFKSVGSTLKGVHEELVDLRHLKGKVDTYSKEWKTEVDNKIQVLELCDSDFWLKLSTNIVIKQDQKIQELQNKVEAARDRECKTNIIIHGLVEEKDGESESYSKLEKKIVVFFKEKMEIEEDIDILDAYRKGRRGFKDRPVLIKLKHVTDKSIILSHTNKLQGRKNIRKQLFRVEDDMTEIQADQRRYYRDLLKENRDKDQEERKDIKYRRGKIMVNNTELCKKVAMPSCSKLLRMRRWTKS